MSTLNGSCLTVIQSIARSAILQPDSRSGSNTNLERAPISHHYGALNHKSHQWRWCPIHGSKLDIQLLLLGGSELGRGRYHPT